MRGNAREGGGLSGLAGLDDARHAVGVALDLFFRKNEASIGGIPFDSFAFMEFEDDGGVFQFALFALAAVGLKGAELVERLLELAGEALAMDAERGDGLDQELGSGGVLEEAGFEERDAVLAPREVGELVDQLGFGWHGWAVFVEELLNVAIEGGRVSVGRTGFWAVRPCLIALSFARCLPASVRGPVERWEFARLTAAR